MNKAFDLRKRWFVLTALGTFLILVALGVVLTNLAGSNGNSDNGARAPTVVIPTIDPGTPPPPVPRPDESRAMSVDAARAYLSQNADLAAVIQAVESKDLDAILALAMPGGDFYCMTGGRGGLPPGCSSLDDKLPSIQLNQPSMRPLWVELFKEWTEPLMTDAGEMRLAMATRDTRTPEGVGGDYYFVFQSERPVKINEGYEAIGLEMKVQPGAPQPIQWFEFAASDVDFLNWLQWLDPENGGRYHILIAPESLRNMVGR